MQQQTACSAFVFLLAALLCSCATILNTNPVRVTVVSSKPGRLIVEKDTLNDLSTTKTLSVERGKRKLMVTVYTDSLRKTVAVKPRNSPAFWANIPYTYGIGLLIDWNNHRRYTYPSTVYIDLHDTGSSYRTFLPYREAGGRYFNQLRLTPLRLASFTNASLEIGYERRAGSGFATVVTGAYLLPSTLWRIGDKVSQQQRGYALAVEEKLYFRQSAPVGPYLAMELSGLKARYRDVGLFGAKNRFLDTTRSRQTYLDSFGVKKHTLSLNVKFGFQKVRKRFVLDLYAGVGIRYKEVTHSDRLKPDDELEMPRHPNIYYFTNKEGRQWTFSMPLNVCIGWLF